MYQGSAAAAVTTRGVENPLDLNQMLDALEMGVFVLDDAHRVVAWNAWIGRVSAVDRNLAVGKTIEDLFSIAPKTRLSRAIELALKTGVASFLSRSFNRDPLPLLDPETGNAVKQNIAVRPVPGNDGCRYCVVQVIDITKVIDRQNFLREKMKENETLAMLHMAGEERHQAILESLVEGVITIDVEGRIKSLNRAVELIFGYERKELIGADLKILMPEPYHSEHDGYIANYLSTGRGRVIGIGRDVQGRRRDGSTFPMELSVAEISTGEERLFAGVVRDVTERHRAQDELKEANSRLTEMALYDHLTGLPNRRLLYDHIAQSMARARRRNESFAVLFIDLDGFKRVNDELGHDAGDALLVEIGARLRQRTRATDIVARLGGDEFAILLENIGTREDLEVLVADIVAIVSGPVELDRGTTAVSASIGVALYRADGPTADALLKSADQAMYAAKKAGKNRYRFASNAEDLAVSTVGSTGPDPRIQKRRDSPAAR